MTTETETVAEVLAEMRETATTGHTIESRGMTFAADPKWFDDWADRIAAAHVREVGKLQEKCAVTLGVGNGDGSLFVHGDYDSIKAVQSFIFRAEQAESLLLKENNDD